MSTNVESLVIEHLRGLRESVDGLRSEVRDLRHDFRHLEGAVYGTKRDVAHAEEGQAAQAVRLDGIVDRLERLERRAGLKDD